MPLDTFICGTCMVSFNDIQEFILHKNELCGKAVDAVPVQGNSEMDNVSAINTCTVADMTHVSGEEPVGMGKRPHLLVLERHHIQWFYTHI